MRKLFLILILIFIAGCIPLQAEKTIKGKGLTADFEKGMPPENIFASDYDNYNVRINLVNYDSAALNGNIYLSDSLSNEKSSLEDVMEESFSIDGRIDTVAGEASVEFGPYHYYKDEAEEGMQTRFNIDVEIPSYESVFNTKFCVGKECQIEETLSLENYSPVKITVKKLLSLGMQGYKTMIIVTIEEISGIITDLREFSVSAAGREFSCSELKFDKKGESVCELDISVDEGFVELPLEISFKYNYKISKSLGPIKIIP